MTNPAAQQLGRLGRGIPKRITEQDRERRRQQARAATEARMVKRGYTRAADGTWTKA
jgi:hypothetical protein